jgi:hypothetical protein
MVGAYGLPLRFSERGNRVGPGPDLPGSSHRKAIRLPAATTLSIDFCPSPPEWLGNWIGTVSSVPKLSQRWTPKRGPAQICSPNGIRTRVATLRGWCPRPLDDGAERWSPGGVRRCSGGRTRTLNNWTRTSRVADYTTPEWVEGQISRGVTKPRAPGQGHWGDEARCVSRHDASRTFSRRRSRPRRRRASPRHLKRRAATPDGRSR